MKELLEVVKCADCGEEITGIYADDAQFSDVTGETHCYPCYESELDHAGTVLYFDPSNYGQEPERFIVSENFGFDKWGDPLDRDRIYLLPDGFPTVANTVEVSNGSDLWGIQTDIRGLCERVSEEYKDGTLPVPVYVTIKQTGNFAVYMTILIGSDHVDSFKEWLGA